MTGRKLAALMTSDGPTPQRAIRTPASAGPTRRAPLKDALFSPTALGRSSGPTISDANACRVGLSTAEIAPSMSASAYTCHNSVVFVRTRTARSAALIESSTCVQMRIVRLGKRSATAPPHGPSSAIGRNWSAAR